VENKTTGLLLIGISLLAAAICYGLERVTKMVESGARLLRNTNIDGSILDRINPQIPIISLMLIFLAVSIGLYLIFKAQK